MKEQFDKELRDLIKDTFEVFDDGLAHDGWKHYQKKIRNKKRRAFILWSLPSGIAAAITLFLLFNNQQNSTEAVNNGSKNSVVVQNKHKSPNTDALTKTTQQQITATLSSESKATMNHPVRNNINTDGQMIASQTVKTIIPYSSVSRVIEIEKKNYEDEIKNFSYSTDITTADHSETGLQIVSAEPKSMIPTTESIFDAKPADFEGSFEEPKSSFAYTDKKNIQSLSRKFKNVKFSLDASTFMNFSKEGVNDNLNLSIGFISEYKISKKFSINSGVNLNRQTAAFLQRIDQPLENTRNAIALTNTIASVINGHFTNAKLVGLDIPINLKYSTTGKKVNWFVSSGFSSYTLLNEKYLNNFSVVNYGFEGIETKNLTTHESHTDNPFSNFQFARSFNFSTGVSFPVKNITTLSIEPFIKYPLRSFGQEGLSLGSGGISFKINLNKNLFKY